MEIIDACSKQPVMKPIEKVWGGTHAILDLLWYLIAVTALVSFEMEWVLSGFTGLSEIDLPAVKAYAAQRRSSRNQLLGAFPTQVNGIPGMANSPIVPFGKSVYFDPAISSMAAAGCKCCGCQVMRNKNTPQRRRR